MTDEAHGTPPQQRIAVTTTAQVERTYYVEAEHDEQARDRLRSHLKDPGMLRHGVVDERRGQQIDATPQRIKGSQPVVELEPPTPS
jgi:hypothetical protein